MTRPKRVASRNTVKSVTFDFLRSHGMTTIFGNPGSTELAFLRDWPNDFRYVLGLQEASVVGMADGYAQATGHAAFVNLHSAAGVGNALGAIFTAYRNQTPLVITAGQQARSLLPLRPFLGATSAAEFPKPYVKWSCEPARPQDVPGAIAQAYHFATQKPWGPAFVSIPSDDWAAEAEPIAQRATSRGFAPDPDTLDQLATALEQSKRPIIVFGTAVDRDGGSDLAIELAEHLSAAVWAAPMTSRKTFPEDHPLFAGFLPSNPASLSETLAGYDFVLVVGAPIFTFHVPGDFAFLRSRVPVYQIADDPDAAASAPIGTSILGTMSLAIRELIKRTPARDWTGPVARHPSPRIDARDPIPAELVMQTIADVRGPTSIILEEAPSHRDALQRYLPIRRDDDYYAVASGGLGFALPAAVGVALARPERRVICVIGDGSVMYSIQSLWTAAQHNLGITVVVLNNGGYGAMRAFSQRMGIRSVPGVDLLGLDFLALAKGFGCGAVRVAKANALEAELSKSLASGRTNLIEVIVDRQVSRLN